MYINALLKENFQLEIYQFYRGKNVPRLRDCLSFEGLSLI